MDIRRKKEDFEKENLSKYATKVINTKGRKINVNPCEIRTDFERDRDRIIHSKAFRRLKHKTQVFISPESDHYRTRLTHTLEVSQIARTIARAINVNEDLTEAIALGHDLGHTPFGHSGEDALNEICPFSFEHNIQSKRVVEVLENHGKGLNLTYEVIDGIKCHCSGYNPSTIEGKIVYFADKIAYINHDIDDAIRGGILKDSDLPKEYINILGDKHSLRINTMIKDLVINSANKEKASMSKEIYDATMNLRKFLFENVYLGSKAKKEESKAKGIIYTMYDYFKKHPNKLPLEFFDRIEHDGIDRAVCDYIAGMTDKYAVSKYKEIFIPLSWY